MQNADIFDLRILSAYELDGQTVKATMTPASSKTYTAISPITNIRFSDYGSTMKCIDWDGTELTGVSQDALYYIIQVTKDGGTTWAEYGRANFESKYPLFEVSNENMTYNGASQYGHTADSTIEGTYENSNFYASNEYYLVREFKNYTISADGKSASYEVVDLGDWTKWPNVTQ